MTLYGIAGAGGCGREVMPVARETIARSRGNDGSELVFVVDDPSDDHPVVNGHRVMSLAAFLSHDADRKYFNVAIADGRIRERLANELIAAGIIPFNITAANAVTFDGNVIGEGAILCPFTIVTTNVRIGRFFHANLFSYVTHDCVIGDFVTFAPGVHCNGRVVVEDHAYIGAGAVIRQGSKERPIVIGKGAVVGMGAVVTKSVKPFTTVVGNPAVELKKAT